jgi:sodium/proline symporter
LAASSSVSENILKGTFHLNVTNKMTMIIARVTVICIAIVAMIIARDPDSSVFNIVSFAWAGFGAAFGPVMLFSLFWKRINIYGAFAGMLAGGGMVFIWKYAVRPLGGIVDIYELLPSFIVACLAIVIVSLLTPKPSKEIEKEYEEYQKMARE